ncbi:MAG: VOC family protein, partial [Actinomycetota bacterium]|nr:VOC family protein [Actinomycetota bacterium]
MDRWNSSQGGFAPLRPLRGPPPKYRIGDIDRSVDFYSALGFEERRRMDLPAGATNVFMGLPGDGDRLELTKNPGVGSYDLGTGYNHVA